VIIRLLVALVALISISSCGRLLPGDDAENAAPTTSDPRVLEGEETSLVSDSIWDLFDRPNPDLTVSVNKYIWRASLDVLSFLPVESVDPFTGVIITGYGTPPGGGRSYRATVHIADPALEARSLNVALQTSGGRPASAGTIRAVEDAILSRARQLRIKDDSF